MVIIYLVLDMHPFGIKEKEKGDPKSFIFGGGGFFFFTIKQLPNSH